VYSKPITHAANEENVPIAQIPVKAIEVLRSIVLTAGFSDLLNTQVAQTE